MADTILAAGQHTAVTCSSFAYVPDACRYVRPRLALVGDAAHTVHPLGGQGVNLGFMDVEALIGALAFAVESGVDIGSMQLLEVFGCL